MIYSFRCSYGKVSVVALLTSISMLSMSCGDSVSCGGAWTPTFTVWVVDGRSGEPICDADVTVVDNVGVTWTPTFNIDKYKDNCPYPLPIDRGDPFTVYVHADGYQPYQIHQAATTPSEPCVFNPISLFAELEPVLVQRKHDNDIRQAMEKTYMSKIVVSVQRSAL